MKAYYSIHPDLGYVSLTVGGSVTLSGFGTQVQSVWSDPGWKPEYNGIIDFSAATIDLSDQEVADLTHSMATDPRCSFGRWALVVSTAADFAKLRKFDPDVDLRSTIRIFFDRHTAEEWLLSRRGTRG
jgi:hypothetical protein